ncbi:MAG: DUF3181 family protein [Chloroflexaceae bacterium]|nr:DUF3181 family protein [Chloroflexaceae bacterium]
MAKPGTTQDIEALAAEIGDKIYMDIAKWHLYLCDAHLHTTVAERAYPLVADKTVTEDAVIKMLEAISVPLGGGRTHVALLNLLPLQCQVNLVDILEDYQRNL